MSNNSTNPVPAVALGASAGAMVLAALYNAYRSRKSEREHPPIGRFVTVDGVKLHYLEKGSGAAVVMLHGNIVTAEDFMLSGVLGLAAKRHHVWAFDRPGFGYSDRPRTLRSPASEANLLRRAFTVLGIERPIVVGHSSGATVALELALNHSDAIGGLVLLSGYYHPTFRADVLLSSPLAIPILGDLMRYTVSPLIGRAILPLLFKRMFAPRVVPQEFASRFPYGIPVRPSQLLAEGQDSATMIPTAAMMQSRYHELGMPVVIMSGTKDRIVNVSRHAIQLHHDIPQSRLRLIPRVGHMVHHAVPEQVVDAIETVAPKRAAAP